MKTDKRLRAHDFNYYGQCEKNSIKGGAAFFINIFLTVLVHQSGLFESSHQWSSHGIYTRKGERERIILVEEAFSLQKQTWWLYFVAVKLFTSINSFKNLPFREMGDFDICILSTRQSPDFKLEVEGFKKNSTIRVFPKIMGF